MANNGYRCTPIPTGAVVVDEYHDVVHGRNSPVGVYPSLESIVSRILSEGETSPVGGMDERVEAPVVDVALGATNWAEMPWDPSSDWEQSALPARESPMVGSHDPPTPHVPDEVVGGDPHWERVARTSANPYGFPSAGSTSSSGSGSGNAPASIGSGSTVSGSSGSSGSSGARLRKRGAFANELWRELVGIASQDHTDYPFGVGGKTSLESVGGWLRGTLGSEAKVRVAHRVRVGVTGRQVGYLRNAWGTGNEELPKGNARIIPPRVEYDWFAEVQVKGRVEVLQISMRLFARLVNYMAFRPRDSGTLLMLRAKAAAYSKELQHSAEQLAWVIHGTVAVAMLCGDREVTAISALGGEAGHHMVGWSEDVRNGRFSGDEDRGFLDYFKVGTYELWHRRWWRWLVDIGVFTALFVFLLLFLGVVVYGNPWICAQRFLVFVLQVIRRQIPGPLLILVEALVGAVNADTLTARNVGLVMLPMITTIAACVVVLRSHVRPRSRGVVMRTA